MGCQVKQGTRGRPRVVRELTVMPLAVNCTLEDNTTYHLIFDSREALMAHGLAVLGASPAMALATDPKVVAFCRGIAAAAKNLEVKAAPTDAQVGDPASYTHPG